MKSEKQICVAYGPDKDVDFKTTEAYNIIRDFIYQVDNSIKNNHQENISDPLLIKIKEIIENTPLSSEHTRFANAAMRTVIENIEAITDDEYLRQSFGNSIRMDFGTGHELNFLCYLYRKSEKKAINKNQVLSAVREYARIVRFYIRKFHIEAAGARGCWSVDDYLLLPYLFGSSENFKMTVPIECIEQGVFREAWECRQKKGLIEGICKLEWPNVNIGLLKMYDEEVLSKRVVTQHFVYSEHLPKTSRT